MHTKLTANGAKVFSKERRLETNKLTNCGWMNRNNKTSNKKHMFYFGHAWLLLNFPPKLRLPKLVSWPPLAIDQKVTTYLTTAMKWSY